MVFHVTGGGWTNQIVIAPWGDVVAIGGHKARLLARHDGRELGSLPVCFTQSVDAAAFVDARRLLVACSEEVNEIFYPGGGKNVVFKFPYRMGHTAIGGGRLVAGADGFWNEGSTRVSVYDLERFELVDEFDASGKIEGIAISADGKQVAVGTDRQGVDVRNVAAKSTKNFLKQTDQRHSALRFSPDAALLFADSDSFEGGEIDLGMGKVVRSFKAGSWLRAMRYVGDGDVLATGSDGLVLYHGDGRTSPSPIAKLGEGLDLSRDGSYFCAAGRGGDVACFSTKKVAPSTFAGSSSEPAATERARLPAPEPPPASQPAKLEVAGELISRAGSNLTLRVADPSPLKAAQRAELHKRFEQPFAFALTGWLTIARVEVKAVQGDTVTVAILEELSRVTMNGKRVDHFTPKSTMKLVLER
jgi:hypothetical protein